MARRLYLHIGTPKSATTYLQDLCGHNAHVLAAAGILWPLGDRYAPIRDLLGTREAAEDAGAWTDLADQIRRHHGDVVFSNEVLVALNVRQISRLVTAVSSTDVWVIITARDLGRVMPSYWQTKNWLAGSNRGSAKWRSARWRSKATHTNPSVGNSKFSTPFPSVSAGQTA
jgi:hypothetical protein